MAEVDTVSTQADGNSRSSAKRSRSWILTWYNFPESYLTFLDTAKCRYAGQIEECPETKRLHIQCAVRFENAVGGKFVQKCFPGSHHEICRSWAHSKIYCSKEQTRVGEPFSNIKEVRKPIDPLSTVTPYDWQQKILTLVEHVATEAEARTVHWFWEPSGGAGKTSLARSLCLRYPGEIIYTNGCGKDVLFAVAGAITEGHDVRAVVYGVNRGATVDYGVLESLGDQIFFSAKYESKMILFAPLHVIVFANEPPIQGRLSSGRIEVTRLNDGES